MEKRKTETNSKLIEIVARLKQQQKEFRGHWRVLDSQRETECADDHSNRKENYINLQKRYELLNSPKTIHLSRHHAKSGTHYSISIKALNSKNLPPEDPMSRTSIQLRAPHFDPGQEVTAKIYVHGLIGEYFWDNNNEPMPTSTDIPKTRIARKFSTKSANKATREYALTLTEAIAEAIEGKPIVLAEAIIDPSSYPKIKT